MQFYQNGTVVNINNIVNYIQYDRHPKNFYNLDIKAVDKRSHKRRHNKEEERQMLVLDFGDMPEKLKGEYLDMYEGIHSEILSTTRFDKNSDLSTIYLGMVDITTAIKIKVKERFPISEQGYTVGKILDGTECQILLDTGSSKSFMSKSYYLQCKSLHLLPKLASKTQNIQVENGQFVSVLFITPIIDIHENRFEIYTLVSEIHENVDLILGIKNIFELEGIINSPECCFSFLSRSIPFFLKENIILKPKEQKLIKVEAPFIDEISRLARIKVLNKNVQNRMVLRLTFIQNSATMDVMNSCLEMVIFGPEEMLGILDLRLMGYYKIKQGILQQNLSKYYRFESADTLCEQFNRFINMLKQEGKEETKGKYPWLDPSNERRYMSDRKILEKYIYLKRSCLIDKEKNQVMDMLYKYK